MIQAGKLQSGLAELQLRSFSAVYHIKFVTHIHHLRSGKMTVYVIQTFPLAIHSEQSLFIWTEALLVQQQ